eukprot:TRINITY_DN36_c0_g1_i1.p1 TRINITY_DN36_c0_g1~~TRINITY_DN36_c0_g1_i1.p1  ORF type:complete len:446 (-),score=95.61 TRINITY_DN36_c0_g1_i1:85-1422(-)
MGAKCAQWCSTLEADSVLAYSTPKVVMIKDARLGLLHYILLVGIFVYIVGYNLIIQGGWYTTDSVEGSVRMSFANSVVTNVNILPYCSQNETTLNGHQNLNCTIWDPLEGVWPQLEESASFLTTHVFQEHQSRVCPNKALECAEVFQTDTSREFYVAHISDWVMTLSHAARAPMFYRQALAEFNGNNQALMTDPDRLRYMGTSKEMSGQLFAQDGTVLRSFHSNTVDQLSVASILQAANIDLDGNSTSELHPYNTTRYSGVILLFSIFYTNVNQTRNCYGCRLWLNDDQFITYQYRVNPVVGEEFSAKQGITSYDRQNRTVNTRSGVRIIFQQTGQIVQFNFAVMLVTLVAGMGLVKVASVLADQIALRIMRYKDRYWQLKYQESETFHTLREHDEQTEATASKYKCTFLWCGCCPRDTVVRTSYVEESLKSPLDVQDTPSYATM